MNSTLTSTHISTGADTPAGNALLGLLLSLQHSDSFFPSGAMAFSWGLESLMRDKRVVDVDSLAQFIEAQILQRWCSFDQGIISAAWHEASEQQELAGNTSDSSPATSQAMMRTLTELDDWVDAMTLSPSLRQGSRRLGLTLITVHAKLGTPGAQALQQYMRDNKASMPHLAVVQGYLWQRLGMSEAESRAVSAHTVCVSASSAAVRLGLIGHLDAQRLLMRMQAPISQALAQPAPALDALSSNLLATDIAALRHELHDARMFAN